VKEFGVVVPRSRQMKFFATRLVEYSGAICDANWVPMAFAIAVTSDRDAGPPVYER
jgi:hypothetical protein